MTATKTKEFTSEIKVLCKVHHANLVISFSIRMYHTLWVWSQL